MVPQRNYLILLSGQGNHLFTLFYPKEGLVMAIKSRPESLTYGQMSNYLVLITLISMVPLEKLCNTTPA